MQLGVHTEHLGHTYSADTEQPNDLGLPRHAGRAVRDVPLVPEPEEALLHGAVTIDVDDPRLSSRDGPFEPDDVATGKIPRPRPELVVTFDSCGHRLGQ